MSTEELQGTFGQEDHQVCKAEERDHSFYRALYLLLTAHELLHAGGLHL